MRRSTRRPAATIAKSPNDRPPAKTEAGAGLNDYMDGWRSPNENRGQALVRLIAWGDGEASKLYDR
jgi:hypothetical protein